jgi:hypothetical protein
MTRLPFSIVVPLLILGGGVVVMITFAGTVVRSLSVEGVSCYTAGGDARRWKFAVESTVLSPVSSVVFFAILSKLRRALRTRLGQTSWLASQPYWWGLALTAAWLAVEFASVAECSYPAILRPLLGVAAHSLMPLAAATAVTAVIAYVRGLLSPRA